MAERIFDLDAGPSTSYDTILGASLGFEVNFGNNKYSPKVVFGEDGTPLEKDGKMVETHERKQDVFALLSFGYSFHHSLEDTRNSMHRLFSRIPYVPGWAFQPEFGLYFELAHGTEFSVGFGAYVGASFYIMQPDEPGDLFMKVGFKGSMGFTSSDRAFHGFWENGRSVGGADSAAGISGGMAVGTSF